ncbi:unnamed protein product [Arctogadus glacialis]
METEESSKHFVAASSPPFPPTLLPSTLPPSVFPSSLPLFLSFAPFLPSYPNCPPVHQLRFRPAPVQTSSGSDQFRFRPAPVQTSSGSDQFRFRPAPVQTSSGSDQFRFRPAPVQTSSGSDQFRFRPVQVQTSSCSDQLQFRLAQAQTSLSGSHITHRSHSLGKQANVSLLLMIRSAFFIPRQRGVSIFTDTHTACTHIY